MEDKDPKPITINDILDQITKTPATPSQGVLSPRPNIPPRPIPIPTIFTKPTPQIPTPQTEIKLPSLGKAKETEKEPPALQSSALTESKLKLSIRTMASDLEKLRRGQKPLGEEVDKDIIRPKPAPLTPSVSTPPVAVPRPISKLPVLTQPLVAEHYHPEKIISREKDNINKEKGKEELSVFPGVNIPKKISKSQEEKVEYGLIAKVIGSGMTTGIIGTVAIALIAYFLISYFVFNQEEVLIPTPTPISISPTPVTEVNEINSIFSDILILKFQLPEQRENTISRIKSFMEALVLEKSGFQRLDITNQSGQTVLFNEILDNLTTSFPTELEKFIKANYLVLIYGQEESFIDDFLSDKRFVFIVEINNTEKVWEIMSGWESALSIDLRDIFSLDTAKEESRNFLDNERRGIKVRYKNFPLPDRSIDYSIVSSLTGRSYLIITNSRESMYSPTDKIRSL